MDISKVKNINYLFYKCSLLTSIPDISNWNIKNVENMIALFYGCSKLIKIPEFIININT